MIILVDMWKCSQCRYTEIRDIPPKDGTDHSTATPHPHSQTPSCTECQRVGNRFDNPYAAPIEPCLYVVELGEQGFQIPNANSRMRAVHDRIGYYPLPLETETLLPNYIIFP